MQSIRINIYKLITVFLLCLASSQAFSYTQTEEECYKAVQGKVSWAQGDHLQWNEANVRNLCKDVIRPFERIACFQKGILAHNSWNKAIQDCAATGGGAITEIVPGKQCIYNEGGYALKVEWYDPGLIVFNGGDPKDYSNYTTPGKPQSSESITLGYSACTDAANRSAVVRIIGHNVANTVISISAGAVTGVASGVLGAFACVGTAGAGCPAAVAGVTVATAAATSAAGAALPNVKEIAYIGVPGSKNYLDFSGTIWKVGIASNVPLSKDRKLIQDTAEKVGKSIKNVVTGGEAGAKSITFNNQAGYVANMVVMYHENKDINGKKLLMPAVKTTGNLSLGISRHIDIPQNIAMNMPIIVTMQGVGTLKRDFYSVSVPANFTGNKCFKSWGTIFDAKGGVCN